MGVKVSLQMGATVHLGHNRRVKSMCPDDGHIDWNRTKDNEILEDKNVRKAYKDVFADAINDYNANQKEERRKIKSYYNKIKNDKQKHNLYEIIVQVGSVGASIAPQTAKEILKEYYKKFINDNKNLVVTGAYLHMDEATPHMHIDFIPVAEFDRGMRKRNSLNRAFEQMLNMKSKTPKITAQIQWQANQREILRNISKEHEIETDEVEHGVRTKHLDTPQYKEVMEKANKDLETAQKKQKELLEKVEKKMEYLSKKIPLDYDDGITQADWTNYHNNQDTHKDKLYGVPYEYVKVPTNIARNISNYALADKITQQAFKAKEALLEIKKELTNILGNKPAELQLHEINQQRLKAEKEYNNLINFMLSKGHTKKEYEVYLENQNKPLKEVTKAIKQAPERQSGTKEKENGRIDEMIGR